MTVDHVLSALHYSGALEAAWFLLFAVGVLVRGWVVPGRQYRDLRRRCEALEAEARAWRDRYARTIPFPDPRGMYSREDHEVSYGCLDTGHHAFCTHRCCGDSEACSTRLPLGVRGSLAGLRPYRRETGLWRWFQAGPTEVQELQLEWLNDCATRAVRRLAVSTSTFYPSTPWGPRPRPDPRLVGTALSAATSRAPAPIPGSGATRPSRLPAQGGAGKAPRGLHPDRK